MPWYYAEGALQNGPVTDEEFRGLVENGKVRGETLVWREGMANWQPYASVATPAVGEAVIPAPPALVAAAPLAAHEVVCQHCGKVVAKENAIQYGTAWVCADCKPVFVQKLREGASVPLEQARYAGFWIRVGAKLIDGLILGVVLVAPFLIYMFRLAAGGAPDPQQQIIAQVVFQLAYWIVLVGFNTFFIGKFAATPGKMACGLRVIMSDGNRVSYGRACGRAFADILSGLICNIGYIIAAFDDQKRALHDHMCDTRVVRK
jgi:uncharacterized RDD family membrane protein YckC